MPFNKPDIRQLSAVGSTVGDVYFPQTELLLPFDGSNGATATSDLSDNNHSVTFVGDAQISTAQSKFGGSSYYGDGTGDHLTIPSSSAFAFAAGDFTIELWVRRTGSITYPYLWDMRVAGAAAEVNYIYLLSDSSYVMRYSVNNATKITGSTTIALNTWHHVALVRSSGTTTLYLDGSSEGSFSDSTSYVAAPLRIGDYSNGGYSFPGHMEDWRITRGVARYTSSFTPPTTTHLTSAGDVNKQILINSTADGVAIGTGGINQARIAKAWANFNGTGTVAIRGSYNVSSITDNGAGIYTVNFSSNMSDTDYAVSGSIGTDGTASAAWFTNGNNQNSHTVNNTTSSCRVSCAYQTAGGHFDPLVLSVNIFGN